MKNVKAIAMVGILIILGVHYSYFGVDHQPSSEKPYSLPERQDGKLTLKRGAVGEKVTRGALENKPQKKQEIRRLINQQKRKELTEAIKMARKLREKWESSGLAGDDHVDGGEQDHGALSKETIRAAVSAVIEDVKTCYDGQLEKKPDLGGKLVVYFVIEAEEGVGGVVNSVKVSKESDRVMRENSELSDCIIDTIYTLELPEPEGGGRVEVSYPFVMSNERTESEE